MVEVLPPNGVESTLVSTISAIATVLVIQTADVARFPPSGTYRALLYTNALAGPWELVKVTGTLLTETVARGTCSVRAPQRSSASA